MAKDLDKTVSKIVKFCSPIAVSTFNDGTGILVIVDTPITSRARRNEELTSVVGRVGKAFEIVSYTPADISELRNEPDCPLNRILKECVDVYGSSEAYR